MGSVFWAAGLVVLARIGRDAPELWDEGKLPEDAGPDADKAAPTEKVSADEAKHEYGLDLVAEPQAGQYDAVIDRKSVV